MEPLLTWLAAPLSGAAAHAVPPAVAWHGRGMVLAWALLVPLAVLLARFFKVTPRQRWPEVLDNPFWWHRHRLLNYGAAALTLAAASLTIGRHGHAGAARALHGVLGWAVLAALAVQIASAHLRGSKGGPTAPRLGPDGTVIDLHGDHYAMTPRRYRFERLHKGLGHATLGLALAAMASGLATADAPRWMVLGLASGVLLYAVVFVRCQRAGRCLDTYQAIWGPDPSHPGNRLPVVGWGVRRVAPPR